MTSSLQDRQSFLWRSCVLAGALLFPGHLIAIPVITEFLASNQTSLEDGDGETSDWIEIHNPDGAAVDLSGYSLSDDSGILQKWTFPEGTSLGVDEHLIVFASGKDQQIANQFHTNFSLAASGGFLSLADPSGVIISEFADYPEQRGDVSYGIGSEGEAGYFSPPTPGNSNGESLSGFVADTTFTKKRGFYDSFFIAAITTQTPDALIRYTLDGSEPTPTKGTLYNDPFLIASSTVLRAISYKEGMVPTNVDAQSYLFTSDIVNQPNMDPRITRSPTYEDEIQEALQELPVVSLSFDEESVLGRGGIYANPNLKGRNSEREIHFEYFDPSNPGDSVHQPAGLRIHGANSRQHPKKPLRIYFRDDYGKSRLEHEVFPESPVKSFKTLLLRGGGHDAWTYDRQWSEASFVRNQFLHQVQRNMGQPSPFGRHVNVFLNGAYWGLYELQEFPHEHYNADHHGGSPEDWDVVKHGEEVEAGTREAWDALIAIAQQGIKSAGDYDAIQEYLDLENFADAMIQRIWASDEDWLSPFFLDGEEAPGFIADKNWYVGRKSRNGTTKFYFYNWDAEMSMGIPFVGPQTFEYDFSRLNNPRSPGIIYDALRHYPEFQIFFADRLRKHCFFGGALTGGPLLQTWDSLTETVRSPVVAESARWGVQAWQQADRSSPFTRDNEWEPAVSWVREQFIRNRTNVVLDQFQEVNLYPEVGAPLVIPFQSTSTTPIEISMSNQTDGSVIFYTIDGVDPRTPIFTTTTHLVSSDSDVRVLVPDADINEEIGFTWQALDSPSNIANWIEGKNGIGFERGTGYESLIHTTIDGMWDVNASAYLRYEFFIPSQEVLNRFDSLFLKMRYDDGFVAYLNETLLLWENYGGSAWNAIASASRDDEIAVDFQTFDLTSQRTHLRVGKNVLAIHGQNSAVRNNDFLIEAALDALTTTPSSTAPSALIYSDPILLNQSTLVKARTLSNDGQWSAMTESYYSIAAQATPENFVVSEIHYHPADAQTPEEKVVSTNKDDYEFLEFLNTSGLDLDLSGCRFSRGLSFTLPQGSVIPPGGRAVIVSNRAAFLTRYGNDSSALILGEFERGSNLANRGETLELLDPTGSPIFSFAYNDNSPWPITPDGDGPSLVLISESIPSSALGDASNWQASEKVNGSPGEGPGSSFETWALDTYGSSTEPGTRPQDISPGNTESNLILYAQGVDLQGDLVRSAAPMTIDGSTFATLTYQTRSILNDTRLVAEVSHDLINWEQNSVLVDRTPLAGGITLVTVRSSTAAPSGERTFFRLAASLAP